MKREIKIRNIDPRTFEKINGIWRKNKYPSQNQFMLEQLDRIVQNDGLTSVQNKFTDELAQIKETQSKVLESLLGQEIKQVTLLREMELLQQLTESWLRFMDDVDALVQKEKAIDEKE